MMEVKNLGQLLLISFKEVSSFIQKIAGTKIKTLYGFVYSCLVENNAQSFIITFIYLRTMFIIIIAIFIRSIY